MVFIILSIGVLHAKSKTWKKLVNVERHIGKCHLKKHIDVLEMRSYYPKSDRGFGYSSDINIYVKPENKIDKKLLSSFKKAKPNFSRKSNIAYPPDAVGKTNRAFVLYDNGKMSRMNEISDVIKVLGDIDTPAEAQLVLWLHAKYRISPPKTLKGAKVNSVYVFSEKYRKVPQGYEILSKYNVYATVPGTSISTQTFESSGIYNQVITAKSLINKKGKIVYFRQIHKSKIKEEESTVTSCASAIE
jgi:hypothetical protein